LAIAVTLRPLIFPEAANAQSLYDRIKLGMMESEIRSILGPPSHSTRIEKQEGYCDEDTGVWHPFVPPIPDGWRMSWYNDVATFSVEVDDTGRAVYKSRLLILPRPCDSWVSRILRWLSFET
jgi:hypothetical protein